MLKKFMSATCFLAISAPFCDAAFKLKMLHFALLLYYLENPYKGILLCPMNTS